MAETLEAFDFQSVHGNGKYPWSDWTNGETWSIAAGEDFDCDPDVMRGQIIVRGRKERRKVETRVVRSEAKVVFRFLPPEPVEAQSA